MKKNLLFVFPQDLIGGAEKAAAMISIELSNLFLYNTHFIYFEKNQEITISSNEYIDLKKEEAYEKRKQNFYKLRISPIIRLIKEIRNKKIDFVISGYEYDVEIVLIICRILIFYNRRTKFISIIQSSLEGRYNEVALKTKLIYKLIDILRGLCFNKIVIVSHNMQEEVKCLTSNKVILIPNPLDTSIDFKRYEDIHVALRKFKNRKFILNISRISSQKNLILLIEAFNFIKDQIPHDLVIIGNISSFPYLRKIAYLIRQSSLEDRVFIIQSVSNVYPLIEKADVIAFTSHYEGLPLFILESMYMKKLIISTKFKGFNDILNENNCILSSSYDVVDFANSLIWGISNSEKTIPIIEAAHEESLKYKSNLIAEEYHKLFRDIE